MAAVRDEALEIVIYLASLVSQPSEIDDILNPVRGITANASGGGQLSSSERGILTKTRELLERYLVEREGVRFFTPETLEAQIRDHVAGTGRRRAFWLAVGVVAMAMTVAMLVGLAPGLPGGLRKVQLAGTVMIAMLQIGAAWLFLRALGSFRTALRSAFVLICVGIVMLAVSILMQPIIEYLQLRGSRYSSILVFIPICLTGLFMYFGVRRYALLMGLRGWWVDQRYWMVAATATAAMAVVLPHARVSTTELIFDVGVAMGVIGQVSCFLSVILMYMIVKRSTGLYRPAARRLATATLVGSLVLCFFLVFRFLAGSITAGAAILTLVVMLLVMGIYFVVAGYTFNKVSHY